MKRFAIGILRHAPFAGGAYRYTRLVFSAVVKDDEHSRFVLATKISDLIYPRHKFKEFSRRFLEYHFVRYYESFDGDEYPRFVFAENISNIIYPKYKFSEFGRLFLEDREFIRWYESFLGTDNYHSLDRKYTLDQLLQLVIHIEGDTAECGVFEGASSFLICRRIDGLHKSHHVFDSFEGLSTPGAEDGDYWHQGHFSAAENISRGNLKDYDFVVFHKGWIPGKFYEVSDNRFCFVHLDVDLYQPTLDSLVFFYERMTPGGIILCDDYGFNTCPGAKKAMDLFFQDKLEEIIRLPTGQALIIKERQ